MKEKGEKGNLWEDVRDKQKGKENENETKCKKDMLQKVKEEGEEEGEEKGTETKAEGEITKKE